jgi:ribosomal protein S18 acetylase RimI-like enzyme
MKNLIARAALKDLPRLAELLGYLFEQESDFKPVLRKQKAGLKAILRNPKIGCLWVAKRDGHVVGMVSLLYTVSTAEGGRVAWLEDLVVDPSYRAQGIGKSLLRFVIAYGRKNGLKRITLLTDMDNQKAKALYKRHGFISSGMTPLRLSL